MGVNSLEVCGHGRYYNKSSKQQISFQAAKLRFEFDPAVPCFCIQFFVVGKQLPAVNQKVTNIRKSITDVVLNHKAEPYKIEWIYRFTINSLAISFSQSSPDDELKQFALKIKELQAMPPEQAISTARVESFWRYEKRGEKKPPSVVAQQVQQLSYSINGKGKYGDSYSSSARTNMDDSCLAVEFNSCDLKWHVKLESHNGYFSMDHSLDVPRKSLRLAPNFLDAASNRNVLVIPLNSGKTITFHPQFRDPGFKLAEILSVLDSCSDYVQAYDAIAEEMKNSRVFDQQFQNSGSPYRPNNRQNGSKWPNASTPYRYNNNYHQRYDNRNRRDGYQRNTGYRRSIALNESPRRNNGYSNKGPSLANRSLTYGKENRCATPSGKENGVVDLVGAAALIRNQDGDEAGSDHERSSTKSPASGGRPAESSQSALPDASSVGGFYGKSPASQRDFSSDGKSNGETTSPSLSLKRPFATPESNQNKKIRGLSSPGTPSSRSSSLSSRPFYMMGFENTGNSCYINSVLQMILNSHYFMCSLKEIKKLHEKQLESNSLLKLLCALMDHRLKFNPEALESQRKSWGDARRVLLANFRSKMTEFNKNYESSQQDCNEFLDQLLEKLKDEICSLTKSKDQQKETSEDPVSEYFSSTIKETLVCQRCNSTTNPKEENFVLLLTMSVPLKRLHLTNLVSEYFDNDERDYSCQKDECPHKKSNATRKLVHLPQILILHLKRVKFDAGIPQKDERPIRFSKYISLKDFCDVETSGQVSQVNVNTEAQSVLAEKSTSLQKRVFCMNNGPSLECLPQACRDQAANSNPMINQSGILVACGLNGGHLQQNMSMSPTSELFSSMERDVHETNDFQESDGCNIVYPTSREDEEDQINAAVASSLASEDSKVLQEVAERSLQEYQEHNKSMSDIEDHSDDEFSNEDSQDGALPYSYRLTGIISHTGSTHTGHYKACVYSFKLQKWLMCSDLTVEEIGEEDVFKNDRREACSYFYLRNEIFQQTESAFGGDDKAKFGVDV